MNRLILLFTGVGIAGLSFTLGRATAPQTPQARPGPSAEASSGSARTAMRPAMAERETPLPRTDRDDWNRKIQEAVAQTAETPAEPAAGSLSPLLDGRLQALGLDSEQLGEVRQIAGDGFDEGRGDPLAAGSKLDLWVRANPDILPPDRWEALLGEHRADVVERRSNDLLTELQGSLSLSGDAKDLIYPELVARTEAEFDTLASGDFPEEEQMAAWIDELVAAVGPALPENQREELLFWAETSLPDFWDRSVTSF